MNFSGAAKRLEDMDLPRLGHKMGVGEDHVHMFLDVETLGKGHDAQGRSIILFERHIFYRELNKLSDKSFLNKAIKQGLANSRPGGYGPTSAQYGRLIMAYKIHPEAALKSCSWGLGQVMGFNYKLAGYDSVEAMVLHFKEDEENQLNGAVNFILNTKLDDELRACKPGQPETCRAFASGYNGSGYRRNNYHVKLASALQKWSRIKDTHWTPEMDKAQRPTKSGGLAAFFKMIASLFSGKGKK